MEKKEVRFKEIKVYPEKCSGCISCQLACSFTYNKSFNPAKSRIIINFMGDIERKISFTEECIRCGTCVLYCNYEALEAVKEVDKGDIQ
ncbi:MAG: 4Fe-4S dicluster domain-containing protein [Deltaproteobacteria bacterium]|nr:4Fe-4S dicluster domain-containing protein [Deltaproteobacteria bacterium]